jgi:hypothetical protein
VPRKYQDREYEETVDPKNPPNSVLEPEVRRATLGTFLGGIVVFFFIVAAALVYWRTSGRELPQDPGDRQPPAGAVGTVGAADTPGGRDPEPRPGSTREELEHRGANDGPAPLPFTELGAILVDAPQQVIGRRVNIRDIDVASIEAGTFWIHDGNAKVQVVPPRGTPAPRAGQVVDVAGTVESDGRSGVRIKASRVAVP